MKKKNSAYKIRCLISLVIYGLGLLVGTAFNLRVAYGYIDLLSFWGYPEQIDYDYTDNQGEISLSGFRCPLLLTPGEAGDVSIRVKNQSSNAIQPIIQVLVSERERKDSYTRLKEEFSLAPGETKEFTQPLIGDNSLLNAEIKVRILVSTGRLHAFSMNRQCPVFIHRLGNLNGTQILILITTLTGLLSAVGILLFWKLNAEEIKGSPRTFRRLLGLAAFVFCAVASNLVEWYFLAMLLFLLEILLIISFFEGDSIEKIFE